MTATDLITLATAATNCPVAALAFTDAVKEAAQDAGDTETGFCGYYPEMGEKAPAAEIHAQLAHYGKHYFIKTPLTIKPGRGIESLGVLTEGRLVKGSKFVGWNEYKVTLKAFDKLKSQYRIASEFLL